MTTPISLRIEEDWLVLLRHLKQRDGTKVNAAINIAIRDYLAKQYKCEPLRLYGLAHTTEIRQTQEQ